MGGLRRVYVEPFLRAHSTKASASRFSFVYRYCVPPWPVVLGVVLSQPAFLSQPLPEDVFQFLSLSLSQDLSYRLLFFGLILGIQLSHLPTSRHPLLHYFSVIAAPASVKLYSCAAWLFRWALSPSTLLFALSFRREKRNDATMRRGNFIFAFLPQTYPRACHRVGVLKREQRGIRVQQCFTLRNFR